MKISLNMNQSGSTTGRSTQDQELERLILAARGGDWGAKEKLAKVFTPLIQDMAKKRVRAGQDISLLVEAGGRGVIKAAKKYRASDGPHSFRVSVVEQIERAIDGAAKGSFFSRLFGG